jgi:hypothetical protein
MSVTKRFTDSDDSKEWERRDDPAELRVGWGQKSLRARGLGLIMALGVGAIIAMMLYTSATMVNAMTREHMGLKISQDRTSCIITMTPQERLHFRDRYVPGAFRQMCPWVDE